MATEKFKIQGTESNVNVTDGALHISVIGTGGGDVDGPASSTDNAIVRFNGTGGKTIQDSSVTIDDNNVLALASQINYKAQTLATNGTIAVNLNSGNFMTLTTNTSTVVFAKATNQIAGGQYRLVINAGTNTLSATWNTNYLFTAGATASSFCPNTKNVVHMESDGTNMLCVTNWDFS